MLQHLQRDSEEVQRLMRDYAPISSDFRTKFAYETLPTLLPTRNYIMIVPKASAVLPGLADAEALAIHKDHLNMVKFVSAEDNGYKKISGHMLLMTERSGAHIRARWASYVPISASVSRSTPTAAPDARITLDPNTSAATSSENNGSADVDNVPSGSFTHTGWTILHSAVNNKSIEGVAAILASGGDPNVRTEEYGWTPLLVAACRGLLEISRLLVQAGANVNTTNHQGVTPLKEAAQIGATELVQLLIENEANVDLAPHDFHDPPLVAASAKNHTEIVRLLLAAGANSRAQQSGGWSSLHYGLLNKNRDMATIILGHGPNINASTRAGLRPLHLAALAGFADICARLWDLGAEMDATDSGGLTALRVAVQAGEFDTVKLLVERGSRTDVVGAEDGYTLFDVALMSGHVRIHRYLMEQMTE